MQMSRIYHAIIDQWLASHHGEEPNHEGGSVENVANSWSCPNQNKSMVYILLWRIGLLGLKMFQPPQMVQIIFTKQYQWPTLHHEGWGLLGVSNFKLLWWWISFTLDQIYDPCFIIGRVPIEGWKSLKHHKLLGFNPINQY